MPMHFSGVHHLLGLELKILKLLYELCTGRYFQCIPGTAAWQCGICMVQVGEGNPRGEHSRRRAPWEAALGETAVHDKRTDPTTNTEITPVQVPATQQCHLLPGVHSPASHSTTVTDIPIPARKGRATKMCFPVLPIVITVYSIVIGLAASWLYQGGNCILRVKHLGERKSLSEEGMRGRKAQWLRDIDYGGFGAGGSISGLQSSWGIRPIHQGSERDGVPAVGLP